MPLNASRFAETDRLLLRTRESDFSDMSARSYFAAHNLADRPSVMGARAFAKAIRNLFDMGATFGAT